MPLRDHFRSPLDDVRSWDGLHGGWPMMMVRQLIDVLPEPYFAEPGVHLSTAFEVDIGTFRDHAAESKGGEGGLVVATYAPPKPTLTAPARLPKQDVYEVRIYDSRRHRRLVAAIEIVSPSNKDRPETRLSFVTKVAALLAQGICISIVDVVTTSGFNLYAEVMELVEITDPVLGKEPPPIYAATIRTRFDGDGPMMDNWYHPLAVGKSLPTLPIWLTASSAIFLDLEACYEETCRTLRIR